MIGEILDGKYRIDKELGAGGMGNVYLATHLGTTRVVAVKVIAPKWTAEPQFLARFQREAQACGRLRHPNIVNVTDFGIAKAAGGDMPYLVMEFLDGQTLSTFQKENPVLPPPLIADLLDQIGLALGEAHRHGIIHRDLKPDNIWLEPNGRGGYTVKVLDFGVAKVNLLGDWAQPVQDTPAPRQPRSADSHSDSGGRDGNRRHVRGAGPSQSSESFGRDGNGRHAANAFGILFRIVRQRTQRADHAGAVCWELPPICRPNRPWERRWIFAPTFMRWPWWRTCWYGGELPFARKASDFLAYHESGGPVPPSGVRKVLKM